MSKKRKRREQQRIRRESTSQEAAEKRQETKGKGPSTQERREARKAEKARLRDMEAREGQDVIRYRPYGFMGAVAMYALGWFFVGATLAFGLVFGQWGYLGYLDSAWLYIALGGVVASPAVGFVARSQRDVTIWGVQAIGVALAALVYERLWGPTCGPDGVCAALGAQGEWRAIGVAIVMAIAFALMMSIGGLIQGWVSDRRPAGSGRTRYVSAVFAMIGAFALIGAPVLAAAMVLDTTTRTGPSAADLAESEVGIECFDFTEQLPDFVLRPHPQPHNPQSLVFLVGIDGDKRKNVEGKRISSGERNAGPTPYEAVVLIAPDGAVMQVICSFIHPSKEQVEPTDVAINATAAGQFYPESDVLQPAVDIVPVQEPVLPGDAKPEEEAGGEDDDADADASNGASDDEAASSEGENP